MFWKYAGNLATAYYGIFLLNQILLFFITLNKLHNIEKGARSQVEICNTNERSRAAFELQCLQAQDILKNNKYLDSLHTVVETTHLCGFISCQDIILPILNSRAGIVFVMALAAIILFMVMGWVEKYREKKYDMYEPRGPVKIEGASVMNITEIQKNGQRQLLITDPFTGEAIVGNSNVRNNMLESSEMSRRGSSRRVDYL